MKSSILVLFIFKIYTFFYLYIIKNRLYYEFKAYDTPLSLIDLHNCIADQIGKSFRNSLKFVEENYEECDKIYDGGFPSVTKAPLNIEKIKQIRLTNVNTHLISCNSICIYIPNRINIFF